MTVEAPDQLLVSTQWVDVDVTLTVLRKKYDPSLMFEGYMAFRSSRFDEPPADFFDPAWYPAAWATDGRNHTLSVLVGPQGAGISLTAGVWHVFVGMTDGDEYPILWAGERSLR